MSPRFEKRHWLIPCLAACAICVGALGFDFIFDDHTLIVSNPQVHSWDFLPRLLSTHLWSHKAEDTIIPQYRPIFSLWLLTVYSFGGQTKWFWHLCSIALHVTASYLVFRLSFRFLQNAFAASCAALLFAVHPIHIEPVCWVSSSNELLYTTFVLGALYVFCSSLQPVSITYPVKPEMNGRSENRQQRNAAESLHGQPGNDWKWLSVVLWGAAIFTKESALPVLAIFFYLALKSTDQSAMWHRRSLEALRNSAPFFATVGFYFVARFLAIHRAVGLEQGNQTWKEVMYSAPSIMGFYVHKMLWPANLGGFYVNPLISAPTTQMWITLTLILVGCGILAWLSLKHVSVGLGSMLLILPMFPVLAGVKVFRLGDLAHDRYMYLPSVGLCILCGVAVKHLWKERTKAFVVAVGSVVLLCFASLTLAQQRFYRDDESYFGRGVEIDSDNVLVRDYLGDYYMMHGKMDLALAQFDRAYEIDPKDQYATFCLARGLFTNRQYANAKPYLEQLSQSRNLIQSRRKIVLLALGQTELKLNHFSRAEDVLKQLESEDDSYLGLHDTLGALYQIQGRNLEAQREYVREVQVSGDPIAKQRAEHLTRLMKANKGRVSAPEPPVSARHQ